MANDSDIWNAVKSPSSNAPFAFRVHRKGTVLRTVRLDPDITYIGRMPENHVVLDDVKVSRSHARVIKMGAQYVIQDQESENGIFVHGKRVQEYPLNVGEKIVVGEHILEVVEAGEDDRAVSREGRLDQEEQEEWRMDQTLSVGPDTISRMMAEARKSKSKGRPAQPPHLSLRLSVGNQKYEKELSLTQGRLKKEKDSPDNYIEIRLSYGKWILYKKEPL